MHFMYFVTLGILCKILLFIFQYFSGRNIFIIYYVWTENDQYLQNFAKIKKNRQKRIKFMLNF